MSEVDQLKKLSLFNEKLKEKKAEKDEISNFKWPPACMYFEH